METAGLEETIKKFEKLSECAGEILSGDVPTENDWNWRPTYLVLSGGGARWPAHIGALWFLEYCGYLSNVKGFSAASAGSLISTLYCLGHTPQDMILLVEKLDNDKILPKSEMPKFFMQGYISDGVKHRKILSDMLFSNPKVAEKYSETTTLQQLYEKSGFDLHMQSVCEETKEPVDFNHKDFPNQLLLDSVFASMCIPWVVKPVVIDGRRFIDGGILNNLPSSTYPISESLCIRLGLRGDSKTIEDPTLKPTGLFGSSKREEPSVFTDIYHTMFKSMIRAADLYSMMINHIEYLQIGKDTYYKQVEIDTKHITTMSFDCTKMDMLMLVEQGIKASYEFISCPIAKQHLKKKIQCN